MPRNPDDKLFLLIQSMTKAEKRNFSIYMQRNPATRNSKVLRLFTTISNLKKYEEQLLLAKMKMQNCAQLPNLKAYLYKQILESRSLVRDTSVEIQLHNGLTYAKVLYKKRLYLQSLQLLRKVKLSAGTYNQLSFLLQCVLLEIKIETLLQADARHLIKLNNEVAQIHEQIYIVGKANMVYMSLCNWHLQNGFVKNDIHLSEIKEILKSGKPDNSFYARMYLDLAHAVFCYIKKDKESFIKHVYNLLQCFDENPHMKEVEADNYLQSLYYWMEACFLAKDFVALQKVIDKLEKTNSSSIYLCIAKINLCLLKQNHADSLRCLNGINSSFKNLDHVTMVLLQKMAQLSVSIGDHDRSIDLVLPVINFNKNTRLDIQCDMRLMHLSALSETGSPRIINYLMKSYVRFIKNNNRFGTEEKQLVALIKKRCRVKEDNAHYEWDYFERC